MIDIKFAANDDAEGDVSTKCVEPQEWYYNTKMMMEAIGSSSIWVDT